MFKDIISHIKKGNKKDSKTENHTDVKTTAKDDDIIERPLDTEFPRSYLFWGKTLHKGIVNNVPYQYPHYECFLANDSKHPTAIKRITGEKTKASPLTIIKNETCYSPTLKKHIDLISVNDDGVVYDLEISQRQSFYVNHVNSYTIQLGRIITEVAEINKQSHENAQRKAKEKSLILKEFGE